MNCNETHTRWHQRLDENGSDPQLDEHLRACEACRRYDIEMGLVTQSLDQLRQDTEAIGSRGSPATKVSVIRGRWPMAIRSLGAVAAAVAIIVTGAVFFPHGQDRSPGNVGSVPVAEVHLGLSLRGKSATKFMVVAKATSDPNVQVFRLYPRLTTNTDANP